MAEAKPGCWWTVVEPVHLKTEVKPEGRLRLTELKGWRDKAQLKAQKTQGRRGEEQR